MSAVAAPESCEVGELISWACRTLDQVSDVARLESELLLMEAAGVSRAQVMAHPEAELSFEQASGFRELVARRSRNEPLAYLVGHREFWSLDLAVCPDVLVPRPETEVLVDAALARLAPGALRVLDLGTGSGAIALALKHERPGLEVTAVDCDTAALEVARANAAALGLAVRFVLSDWFAALGNERFDLIVSNPPYVRSADPHFRRELAAEPRLALDGGADGLDAYRSILADARSHLAAGGWLLLEHGFDQREALAELAVAAGFAIEAQIDDLAGQPRVMSLQVPVA